MVTPNYPPVQESSDRGQAIVTRGDQQYNVYASWTKHKRISEVTVSTTYQILEVKTGRIIDANSITKTATDVAQWITYDGDEAAIPLEVKAYNTTGDVAATPAEILANSTLKAIGKDIAERILKVYKE